MGNAAHTVWLQTQVTPPAGGCSGCATTEAGPVCRSKTSGLACLAPALTGDATTLARVMDALNHEVVDSASGRGIVDLHWVKSLRLADSEAELTVTFPPNCGGGKQLAEEAFATLRRQMPDCDVYVFHR
jgi:metal-sulfur cluster biosynthetic enzyme